METNLLMWEYTNSLFSSNLLSIMHLKALKLGRLCDLLILLVENSTQDTIRDVHKYTNKTYLLWHDLQK